MGFYGHITNTDRIQFTFDKTYQNRKSMEENMAEDNIYIGRYVLIDYDLNFPGKNYNRLYKYSDTQFYFSPGWEQATRAKSSPEPYYLKDEEGNIIGINTTEIDPYTLYDKEPIYVWDEDKQLEIYYQALYVEGSNYPKFELIDSPSGAIASSNFYYGNYMIDKEYYGDVAIGRGWDSTVWQKVYSDNQEKYVMIAELNSVVPTFDLAVDQPTLNPMTPHFDSDSSSLYYRLHVQPNWGFRVANYDNLNDVDKAKYGSDTRVNNSGWNYDTDLKRMQMSSQQYNGAIYFNKDGFDPNYRTIKDSSNDEISMKPTGSSGLQYYDRHGAYMNSNTTSAKNDIQELFINLPSIGDTVSEMWDKIYGQGIVTPEENVYRRNTSMEWDTYAGERLIKETDSGTGYDFTPEQTASIAGVVNSVHDLMGMVIIEDNELAAENALIDHIYYRTKDDSIDKGFFIKDLVYIYEESDQLEEKEKVELKDFNEQDQKYYYKKKKNYYLADEYQTGAQYFSLPTQIDKQLLTDYEYKPNTYYSKDVNGSYVLATEEVPRQTRDYYVVPDWDGQAIPSVDNKYIFFYPTDTTYYNKFFTGSYSYDESTKQGKGSGLFTIDKDKNLIPFVLEDDDKKVKDLYWWENYIVTTEIDVDRNEVQVFDQESGTSNKLTMVLFEANKYFSLKANTDEESDQNYIILKNQASIALETAYYTFPEGKEPIQITGKISGNSEKTYFYEPNKYYYREGNDYIFAEELLKLNKIYYNLDENEVTLVTGQFYEPNKYYYKENDNWFIDTNDKMTANREYYNIYTSYVIDGAGKFNTGEKWNPLVEKPSDVKLGLRKEAYQWKELAGFARKLNTIHGLIIKINQIIKFNDALTRDTSTVQGCINQLNDIIDKFETLVPNQLALVNQYGKIASGSASGDDWVNITTDNGEVKLSHIGPVGTNDDLAQEADVTPQFGETFTIVDYGFDSKGHKYAKKSHAVTVPKGSLTNSVAKSDLNAVTDISFVPATGAITVSRTNIADLKVNNDQTLQGVIDSINQSISNEATARENADTTLQANINKEASDRETADDTLQSNINNEATERATADSNLGKQITALESSTSSDLSNAKTELENKITAIQNELTQKDEALNTAIEDVDVALTEFKTSFTGELGDLVYSNTKFDYIIGGENSNSLQDIINSMNSYINDLQLKIVDLEARIEVFESEGKEETEGE